MEGPEAIQVSSGKQSAQKNEILMKHGINLLDLPESNIWGTTLICTSAKYIIQTTEYIIKMYFFDKIHETFSFNILNYNALYEIME